MIPARQKRILDGFVTQVREVFRHRLLSVTAYGSILTARFRPGHSDINLLVVVDPLDAGDLCAFRRRCSRAARRHRIRCFFFTPSFIRQSADTFPIEWREISLRRMVLFGTDFFAEIPIRREHLRLQIEREVKQNYLAFAQALARYSNLADALMDSVKPLEVLLRNVQEVFGTPTAEPPVTQEDLRKRPGPGRLRRMVAAHLAFLENLLQWCEENDRQGERI